MNKQQEFNADEMFTWVEQQSRMGARRPGSPAGHENEDYLESRLKEFGLENVRKEPIPITYWAAKNATLEVNDNGDSRTVESFPIPYTAFTPSGGIEGPLAYVNPKRLFQRDELRGSIALTEIGFPPLDVSLLSRVSLGEFDPDGNLRETNHPATWVRLGWHLYHQSARRGAAGFIGIIKDQPGGSCRMYAPYGFKERDILDKPLPGLWVGRDDGERLVKISKKGSGRAMIRLSGIREQGITHNIVGEIPGRNDEAIVLSCHHDSPFESPVEDATGVAVVLALARHFSERRDLKRRIIILFSAGHFYGSIGTRTFIREHRSDIVKRTAVEISIEHIAKEAVEDSDGSLIPSGLPEASGIFTPINRKIVDTVLDGFKRHDVRRVFLLPAEGPFGDYPPTDGGDWYEAGVPVINYICNPVYLLTADDALKWVDRDRMAKVAGAFTDIIRRFDTMSRHEIGAVDSLHTRLFMKLIKHIARARTTSFGMEPVY